MVRDTILAFFLAFFVCVLLCPIGIPILHRMKFGQQVRTDGPSGHLKKKGTPTMGGIMIVFSVVVGAIPFCSATSDMLPILLFVATFGGIGFLDDWLKIRKKQSEGLSARQKFMLQLIATAILSRYLSCIPELHDMLIPFTGDLLTGRFFHLRGLFIPWIFLVVLGTDNGVNFTDGLDGLCASVTIVVSVFFAAAAIRENIPVSPVSGAVCGALLGFLLFNCYPARVFMGDTGALALGGYVSAMALILRMPLFVPVIGFVYLAEVLSVMVQVGYFKKSGGKRFFRMAPLHHHFELGGWSETRIVTAFTVMTALLSLLSWLGLG